MTQDTTATCPVTSTSAPRAAAADRLAEAGCPVSGGGYDSVPAALGPDSLTWKHFGQWTGMLQGPWAGSMQNMHPQLGAAVAQHSIFFLERMPRLFRSVYPIGGVVFDGARARTTGQQVRDYHIGITGVDEQGRRYSALNPDVFYWAHATFFKSTLLAAEWLGGGLTEAQKRQLFDEHVTWYRMYGMSMRPVPATWEDFCVYWERMCTEVLEDNWATRAVLDLSDMPKHPSLEWLPDWLWRVNVAAMQRFFDFTTVGLFDPAVRERLGYSWSPRQERLHALFGRTIHQVTRFVPPRLLMHPRKRSAWDRAHGRLPEDAPLVETPARNLPPVAYRGDPHYYCPEV